MGRGTRGRASWLSVTSLPEIRCEIVDRPPRNCSERTKMGDLPARRGDDTPESPLVFSVPTSLQQYMSR